MARQYISIPPLTFYLTLSPPPDGSAAPLLARLCSSFHELIFRLLVMYKSEVSLCLPLYKNIMAEGDSDQWGELIQLNVEKSVRELFLRTWSVVFYL